MKKEDIKYLVIFIILIVLILSVFIYDCYKNRMIEVDRKVDYIFNYYSYPEALNNSQDLFFKAIDILDINNLVLEKDKIYSIKNYNKYQKILNFNEVTNVLSHEEVQKYMDLKKIIYFEDNYYIESYKEEYNQDYIGSMIDLINYDNDNIYLTATNYYCHNYDYIGLLNNKPDCDYTSNVITFTVGMENNNLRINDISNIVKVIK